MKTITDKLLEVQKEMGAIKKDKENPVYKSSYVDINGLLAAVKPVLTKHNLVLLQPLTTLYESSGSRLALKTIIRDVDSHESIEDTIPLPTVKKPTKASKESTEVVWVDDPQKDGSTITYYRRYSLISLLALEAEDDDGNAASGKESEVDYNEPPTFDEPVGTITKKTKKDFKI